MFSSEILGRKKHIKHNINTMLCLKLANANVCKDYCQLMSASNGMVYECKIVLVIFSQNKECIVEYQETQ